MIYILYKNCVVLISKTESKNECRINLYIFTRFNGEFFKHNDSSTPSCHRRISSWIAFTWTKWLSFRLESKFNFLSLFNTELSSFVRLLNTYLWPVLGNLLLAINRGFRSMCTNSFRSAAPNWRHARDALWIKFDGGLLGDCDDCRLRFCFAKTWRKFIHGFIGRLDFGDILCDVHKNHGLL